MGNNPISHLGLLFGSFDPIHNGHLEIIDQALGQCDQIRLIVQSINAYKSSIPEALVQHRINMAKLAIEKLYPYDRSDLSLDQLSRRPQVPPVISVHELRPEVQPSHSIFETLANLHQENKERELLLFLGQDLATSLPTWKDYDQIQRLCQIVEVMRSQSAISSNQVKRAIKHGGSISELVPTAVEEYILENSLYT